MPEEETNLLKILTDVTSRTAKVASGPTVSSADYLELYKDYAHLLTAVDFHLSLLWIEDPEAYRAFVETMERRFFVERRGRPDETE